MAASREKWDDPPMKYPRLHALLVLLVPAASTACVETGVHEQTVQKLEETRRALTQRETELRAYQWQAATLTQQLHDAQQRSDARERELHAQVQRLTGESAGLAERLKTLESERASLIAASGGDSAAPGRDGKTGVRPEELRRMIAAADARNAAIVEELTRIERLLGRAPPALPPLPFPSGDSGGGTDVRDPWSFSSRK